MKPVTYTTHGKIRGQCAHKHRTLDAAVRCILRDRDACARLSGMCYSDRSEIRGSDGSVYVEGYRDADAEESEWLQVEP